uniref:MD-2-related lipid-recognition domain-containing protein n=1 Tax=Anopheles funestus TaxID=62324 RepID=A0A182RQ16_ANOFN
MQLLAFVSIIAFSSLATADVVIVQQCSDGPLPASVDVIGCAASPCELQKGKDSTVLVDFKADRQLVSLVPQIQTIFAGATIPFELPDDQKDACKSLIGGMCPVSQDEDVTYQLRIPVLASYPSITLTVELKLVDQDDTAVTCFQLAAKVV